MIFRCVRECLKVETLAGPLPCLGGREIDLLLAFSFLACLHEAHDFKVSPRQA